MKDILAIREQYGVTKKEAAILAVLLDGKTHDKADLQANALNGQASCAHLVPVHIYRMRAKLAKQGISIISVGGSVGGLRGRGFVGWRLRLPKAAV